MELAAYLALLEEVRDAHVRHIMTFPEEAVAWSRLQQLLGEPSDRVKARVNSLLAEEGILSTFQKSVALKDVRMSKLRR
eukprot:gene5339-5874_t